MTTKKIEQNKWSDIDFVGYEAIKPTLNLPHKWLTENNVITVTTKGATIIMMDCQTVIGNARTRSI